ncbi:MAG TPA: EamA family transporter [Xanthomonadales bacterium]|nr:EamA family transporter [Xanthomonadales bacterium]
MQNLILFVTSVLIWGSTWLAINFQLGVVAPEVSVFYRQALASSLLFAWALLRGMNLRFSWRAHGWFLLLGMSLFGFNYVLAYSAQNHISSAMNAVLFATMVWINVLLSRLFFRTPFEWHVLLGAALGMAGVVVLFWPSLVEAAHEGPSLVGIVISLSGATIASLGNMASHQAQRERLPVLQSNAWGMFYGALVTGFWALLNGKPFNFELTGEYVGSLLYLAIVGSVIAFGCYLKLLGNIGPTRAGYIAVVIPIIAVLISIAFEGLQLNAYIVGGFVLVLGGNLLILAYRRLTVPRRPI